MTSTKHAGHQNLTRIAVSSTWRSLEKEDTWGFSEDTKGGSRSEQQSAATSTARTHDTTGRPEVLLATGTLAARRTIRFVWSVIVIRLEGRRRGCARNYRRYLVDSKQTCKNIVLIIFGFLVVNSIVLFWESKQCKKKLLTNGLNVLFSFEGLLVCFGFKFQFVYILAKSLLFWFVLVSNFSLFIFWQKGCWQTVWMFFLRLRVRFGFIFTLFILFKLV